MPPRKTHAAGPRPLRRSASNKVATATPALSISPKTPEQSVADRKSYSAPGLNAGDSSVEPSPCSLIPDSFRDGPEVEEPGVEKSDPGFGCGDRGGGGTEVEAEMGGEGSGGYGVDGDVSTVETVGEGQVGERSGTRRKRIVRVVKVVKKRVPKEEAIEGQGEGRDGAECKQEVGKSLVAIPVDKNGNDSVAMEVDGDNGGINIIARAGLPVKVEGSIAGEFNEGDTKESAENVDFHIQVNENGNGDIALASVGLPVGFEKSVYGEDYEGDMKECEKKEDHDMEDRKRIESGHSEEGVNKDAVAAGSDRVGCSDNVVSSADSKEEVDRDNIRSSAGLKEEPLELNCGLLWRGEMEALERKRRRKTEIFVGGLAKDDMEDDVRKVFEEVGEIVDARVVKSSETGKSKGYAFVRYAVAADAKKSLEKDSKVKLCGKECGTRPVEGNDTIFLGNINKQWKEGDVTKLLQDIGVHKIDKVTAMTHPNIADRNWGFAFVELESNKDADVALKKLQKQDELGKLRGIKVAWAKPLSEPDEEEMQKKSRRERRKDARLAVKKNKHHLWLQQQQEKKTKGRMVEMLEHIDADFDQELDFTENEENVRFEPFPMDHSPSPKVKKLKKSSKKRLTKFEEYLQQDIGKLSESAEADLKLERKLAKKLKVKDRLLGGVDDGMNLLFEGLPSILEEETSIGRDESTSSRKKKKRVKQEHVESVEQGDDANDGDSALVESPSLGTDLEKSPLKGHFRKKGRKRQHMRRDDLDSGVNESENVEIGSGVSKQSSTLASLGDNVKYVPPHLRSHSGSESEERAQFRKRLRGLLNRLSESNVESITGEVASIYSSFVRSVATEITIEEILASCVGGPRGNEQYASVFASFVVGMACLVGLDFSAKLLASLANYFENEYLKEDNLSLRNLTLLLSCLCVFGACSSDLIYDFMTILSQRLTEIDVSTILTILECCGMRIRADDPTAMKKFVVSVQNRVNELKASSAGEQNDINSKRMEFMLEAICDIKNNKKRTKEEPAPHTRIKKWLQKLGIENILLRGIKWSKLLDPYKKGQWWLSGHVAVTTDVIAEVATTIDKENAEAQNMLLLASSQRMNTVARRAIFCIIMSGEDYIDAFEKLLRLDLPGKQDREIMRVLVECCLQEKVFNKYYVALASKLCEHDKNHKFTLQFCLWDHFKELDSMPLLRSMHLAKFVMEMFSSFNISIAVLKTVDFNDAGHLTPKRIMHFRMLFDTMFQYPDNLIWNVFARIAVSPELEVLRHGIEYFIREHVVNADKSLAEKFKLLRKALNNIEGILM